MSFDERIDQIRQAKRQADEVMDTLSPGHTAAEAVVAYLWEALFDHFCLSTKNDYDLDEIAKLSSVIQRMVSTNTALKTLEHKVIEQRVKEEDRAAAKQALAQSLSEASTQGLTPETIAEIEQRLALL
ncbi:MAG: hypothetical protein ACFBZ8_13740 [Opitutales bacterium]